MISHALTLLILMLILSLGNKLAANDSIDSLRLNQIQVKATHNSYHLRPSISPLSQWNYSMPTLHEQLGDYHVRSLELDIHISHDQEEIEVYHIYGIDSNSSCKKFIKCLLDIRTFSQKNPRHSPIFVWIEIKDQSGGRPFDHFELLESNIQEHLGDRLVTPNQLRAGEKSLKAAILQRNWPTVGELAGKIIFILHTTKNRHARIYTYNFTSLHNRLMFAKATYDQRHMPWALFTYVAADKPEIIARLKKEGLLVMTSGCLAKLSDDECLSRRALASKSGANFIKEDYPGPNKRGVPWLKLMH